MRLTKILLASGLCVAALFTACNVQAEVSPTLQRIQERGYLKCGISEGLPGFSFFNDDGSWTGLDVDVCRAIAAAIFHDDKHVRFIPLSAKDRFTAIQSGEVDILSRNTTWTLTRDAEIGLVFTTVIFFDGQGFMARKNSKFKTIQSMGTATICCNSGTTTELNAADFFKQHNINYKILTFEKDSEIVSAYDAGRCDVYTADRAALAAQRLRLAKPQDHIILPETISKEPLAPAVRQDDAMWLDVVRWIIFGLMNAEEAEITRANIDQQLNSSDPTVMRLLGKDVKLGNSLGLSGDFLYQALKVTGNYGEIFDRNVGENGKLKLPRGLNNLWTHGGLIYGAPYR